MCRRFVFCSGQLFVLLVLIIQPACCALLGPYPSSFSSLRRSLNHHVGPTESIQRRHFFGRPSRLDITTPKGRGGGETRKVTQLQQQQQQQQQQRTPLFSSPAQQFQNEGLSNGCHGKMILTMLKQQLLFRFYIVKNKIRSFLQNKHFQTLFLSVALLLLLTFPAAAVTGGRAGGGSFGRSSSGGTSTMHRVSSSPQRSYYSRTPTRIYSYNPSRSLHHYGTHTRQIHHSQPRPLNSFEKNVLRFLVGLLILSKTNSWLSQRNSRSSIPSNNNTSSRATASVVSMTVALRVPDRTTTTILQDLRQLATQADTSTREGVSRLVSEAALMLLRHESSIVSAVSSSRQFRDDSQASREYNTIAIQERSKYDQETLNKYGADVDMRYDATEPRKEDDDTTLAAPISAAMAVVTLIVNVGGRLNLPEPRSRASLRKSLTDIAAGVLTDNDGNNDVLMAGQVLWTPEQDDDILTVQEVYAKYPNLIPVI